MHNLAALVLKLHLLGGETFLLHAADLRNEIIGKLRRKSARIGKLLAAAQSSKLLLELTHARNASARSRLVRAHNHALDARELVQRPGGHQADDGRTVGIGDKALVPFDVLGVNLGHHQGNIGVKTERMGVVHNHSAALHGLGQKRLGEVILNGAEYDIAALKRLGAGLLDHHLLAAELNSLAGRASARQQLELAHGEILLVKALEHLGAHGSRRAQNSHRVLFHASPF